MIMMNAIVHRAKRIAATYQNALLQPPKNADRVTGCASGASGTLQGSAEARAAIGRGALGAATPVATSCCRSKPAPAAGADRAAERDSEVVAAGCALRRAAGGGSAGRSCPGSRAVGSTAAIAGAPATCGL